MLTILIYMFKGSMPDLDTAPGSLFLLTGVIDFLNMIFGFLVALNVLF